MNFSYICSPLVESLKMTTSHCSSPAFGDFSVHTKSLLHVHTLQRFQQFDRTARHVLSFLATARYVVLLLKNRTIRLYIYQSLRRYIYKIRQFIHDRIKLLLVARCSCGCCTEFSLMPILRSSVALSVPFLRLFLYIITKSNHDAARLLGTKTAQGMHLLQTFVQGTKRRTIDKAVEAIDKSYRATAEFSGFVQSSLMESKRQIVNNAKQRTPWAQPFHYYPLIEDDEIRLVVIHPGPMKAQLVCTLIHVELRKYLLSDDTQMPSYQSYEALSYTWGDPTALTSIMCYHEERDGTDNRGSMHEKLDVTANCAAALRRLRLSDQPRRVWIDAICIDQRNIKERNSQVRMMARIYGTASRTVVYLGEVSKCTSSALAVIFRLHEHGFLTTAELLRPERVEALQDLLGKAWFSRIWVLQEVYMARSTIALLGSDSYRWKALIALVKEARVLLWDLIPIDIPYVLSIHDDNLCAKNLFDLLCGSRHCAATDPRDKYFALLSMVKDAHKNNLTANYSKGLAEIFTKLAIYLLEHISLDFLTAIEGSFGCGTFPSWVPDWSISCGLGYLPPSKTRVKRAGGPRSRSEFKLEEMVWYEPPPDDKFANYLLEQDELRSDFYSFNSTEKGYRRSLPPSQHGCGIICNWNSLGTRIETSFCASEDASEDGENVIEHRGTAADWSNFRCDGEVYLNPIPEDWSVILHRYCTDLTGSSPNQPLRNDLFQLPVLTVRGVLIDRIRFVTSKCNLRRVDWLDVISDWHKTAFAEESLMIKEGEAISDCTINYSECYKRFTECFYRTISWDSLPSYHFLSMAVRDNGSVSDSVRTLTDVQSETLGFKAAVKLVIDNRRLFLTTGGRLGLCPDESKIGDVVCVFSGAVYPCVLRRMTESSGYSLVGGTCYLNGVMDGEAFNLGLELDDFVIW